MSHTPGPWDQDVTPGGAFAIYQKAGICPHIAYTADFFNVETNQGNAHLISAAPELLAALEWAEMMIDNLRNRRGCGQIEGDDCQKACKNAINKARGVQ